MGVKVTTCTVRDIVYELEHDIETPETACRKCISNQVDPTVHCHELGGLCIQKGAYWVKSELNIRK